MTSKNCLHSLRVRYCLDNIEFSRLDTKKFNSRGEGIIRLTPVMPALCLNVSAYPVWGDVKALSCHSFPAAEISADHCGHQLKISWDSVISQELLRQMVTAPSPLMALWSPCQLLMALREDATSFLKSFLKPALKDLHSWASWHHFTRRLSSQGKGGTRTPRATQT